MNGVKVSDAEISFSTENGVGHPYDCPAPPITNGRFWLGAPFLKFPIEIGEKWSFSNGSDGMIERIIEADNETVNVPAGRFSGAVRVKSTFQSPDADERGSQMNAAYNSEKGFRDGEKWMWFAPGAGVIKAEHHQANGRRTVVELTEHHLAEPSDAYLPLAIGNRWCYEWRNEDGDLLFKEQQHVVLEHEGKFYLADSGYTINTAEYGEHKYG